MTGKKNSPGIRLSVGIFLKKVDKICQDSFAFKCHLITTSHQFYFPGSAYGIADIRVKTASDVVKKLPGTFSCFATGSLIRVPFMNIRQNSRNMHLEGLDEVRAYMAKIRWYARKHKLTPEELREISMANGIFDPDFINYDDDDDLEES